VRNAPTALMKALGAGAGYQYAHDSETGYFAQEYLPDELRGKSIYEPGRFGFEGVIEKRLAWWAKQKGGGPADAGGG
jgi:putative ATPase